jgi:hypothetical protein
MEQEGQIEASAGTTRNFLWYDEEGQREDK